LEAIGLQDNLMSAKNQQVSLLSQRLATREDAIMLYLGRKMLCVISRQDITNLNK